MSASSERCPFCSQIFKSLSQHLPRCKARNGHDYKHLLRSSSHSQPSPSRKKVFKRLDLHLRSSYSCGLSSSQECVDKSVPNNVLQLQTHSESSAPAKHKRTSPTGVSVNVLILLKLPDIKDFGSWFEANATFSQVLSSNLLLIEDTDELHDTLVYRIYSVHYMGNSEIRLLLAITSIGVMIVNLKSLGILRMMPEELLGLPNGTTNLQV